MRIRWVCKMYRRLVSRDVDLLRERSYQIGAARRRVAVASTVGAGDSLLAGMLHGLLSGEAPEHTLRRATAIAAMAVTQIGFGISDDAQLAHLESGVLVRPLTEQ